MKNNVFENMLSRYPIAPPNIFDSFFDFGRPKSKKLDNDNIIVKNKKYGNI